MYTLSSRAQHTRSAASPGRTLTCLCLCEVVDEIHSLLDIVRDGAADIFNIKISKFGGLSKVKQAVDL